MIVCRQCGHENREATDFCASCGAFLEWEGERRDPPVDPASPPPGPRPPAPHPGEARPPDGPPPAGPQPDGPPPAGSGQPSGGPTDPPRSAAPAPADPPGSAPDRGGDTVICLECGGRNDPDRRFCKRCGSTLDLVALSGRSPHAPGDAGSSSAIPGVPAPPRPGSMPGPAIPPDVPGEGTGAPRAEAPTDVGGATAGGLVARPPSAPVPAAPRVEARPPAPLPGVAPAPARGVQPAEPKARPAPARPQRAEPDVAPGGPTCPDCGTANPPGRRFCRRCGTGLPAGATPAPAGAGVGATRRSWWRRFVDRLRGPVGRDGDDEGARPARSARAAYRRSLDVRFRVLRVLAVLAGLGLLAGGLGLVGLNPISGARGLWDRFFPRYERIGELRATVQPEGTIEADFPPGAAVDGDPSTAWATTWLLEPDAPAAAACASGDEADGGDEAASDAGGAGDDAVGGETAALQGGAAAGLVVNLPQAVEVAKIEVQPGLEAGDPARAGQWRPTLLEVRFDDGTCETVELDDAAGIQDHRLDGPQTTTVRVRVLDAAPPTDPAASRGLVAVGEVRVFAPG